MMFWYVLYTNSCLYEDCTVSPHTEYIHTYYVHRPEGEGLQLHSPQEKLEAIVTLNQSLFLSLM